MEETIRAWSCQNNIRADGSQVHLQFDDFPTHVWNRRYFTYHLMNDNKEIEGVYLSAKPLEMEECCLSSKATINGEGFTKFNSAPGYLAFVGVNDAIRCPVKISGEGDDILIYIDLTDFPRFDPC